MSNWSSGQTVSGPQFGASVALIGDLDNDGVNDIIVGAPADKNGVSTGPMGSAFIVFLRTTGATNGTQKLSPGIGNFPAGALGVNDQFGSSVAGASLTGICDVNGDGVPDVAIGAPYATDGASSSGAFFIVGLGTNGKAVSNGVTKISNSAPGMNSILPKNENFGSGLTYVPDFGYANFHVFAVGAGGGGTTTASSTGDNDFRTGSGAVFIVFLNLTNDTVQFVKKISGINAALKNDNNHLVALDHFGLSIIDNGTAKNNTVQKLIIGAPYDSGFNFSTGQGSFYEINFVKPDVKVDTIIYPTDTVCGNSAPQIGIVFENITPGPLDSIPFKVRISGAGADTLKDTFYATAGAHTLDTLFFKQPFPTNASGTYTIQAFPQYPGDLNPYDDSAYRTVYVLPLFTKPNFGADTVYSCPYTVRTLDMLNSGSAYKWYKDGQLIAGATSEKYVVPYSLGDGKYVGVATIGQCSISDSIQIFYVKNAKVSLGPDQVVCYGLNDTLSAGYPDAQHAWFDAASPFIALDTAMQYIISNNKNASYIAQVSYSKNKTTCNYRDTIKITYNRLIPNLGPDTVLCQGGNYVLNGLNPGSSYSWYKDGVKQTDTLQTDTVVVSGKYYVIITNGQCVGTDTANITFLPMPVFSFAPKYDTLCGGAIRILDAGNPSFKHVWSQDGNVLPYPDTTTQYKVTTDGTYIAVVENRTRTKCRVSDTAHVTYNTLSVNFNFGTVPPALILCEGTTKQLQATPTSTIQDKPYYQWYKNGVIAGNQAAITIDIAGEYKVIVTVGNCTATDSVSVSFTQITKPDFGARDTFICKGSSIELDAGNPGATYLWTTPKGNQYTEQITADTDFNYTVKVYRGSCIQDTSIRVHIIHIAVHLGKDTSLCTGSTITLDAQNSVNNASYQWYLNGVPISGATLEKFNPQETGTYMVQVFQKQCADSGKVNVTFLPAPVTLQFDTILCHGDSIVLDAGNPGYHIQWDKPFYQTTQKIKVYQVPSPYPYDQYAAHISNGPCSGTSIFRISYYDSIALKLPQAIYLCDSLKTGVRLDAGAGYATYNWEPTGDKSSSILATTPGKYTVTVTNAGGCSRIDSSRIFDCPPNDLYIPNAFTPNSDDVNDSFRIYNVNSVYYQLTVYNRWGERVFFSNDPHHAWDGNYEGIKSPEGVYKWTLVYRLNTSEGIPPQKIISGNVMLLRP